MATVSKRDSEMGTNHGRELVRVTDHEKEHAMEKRSVRGPGMGTGLGKGHAMER